MSENFFSEMPVKSNRRITPSISTMPETDPKGGPRTNSGPKPTPNDTDKPKPSN